MLTVNIALQLSASSKEVWSASKSLNIVDLAAPYYPNCYTQPYENAYLQKRYVGL